MPHLVLHGSMSCSAIALNPSLLNRDRPILHCSLHPLYLESATASALQACTEQSLLHTFPYQERNQAVPECNLCDLRRARMLIEAPKHQRLAKFSSNSPLSRPISTRHTSYKIIIRDM